MTMCKKVMTVLGLFVCSSLSYANIEKPVRVGIVVPLEHRAMQEIVSGFKQELAKKYHGKVTVIVKNAQHDPMLEKAIIDQFKAENMDVVEPIGTDAFEMTMSQIRQAPVIGIAAGFTAAQRSQLAVNHATDVDDEVSAIKQMKLLQAAMGNLKKITLIHSADNKIFSEVSRVQQAASQLHVQVQNLMVTEEPDLYTVSHHIASDSQAIFILKDHLIVNGIATLVKQARSLGIPVITSDEGSVEGGAAFALGVRERETGALAADLTAEYLQGKPISEIPITKQKTIHVYINKAELMKQGVDYARVESAAKQLGYNVVLVNNKVGLSQ